MISVNLNRINILIFFLIVSALVFTTPLMARDGTRIIISTSGPAKFNSYWIKTPPGLVIEFQTKNIVSDINNEIIVEQGAIKRVQTEYFGEGENRKLKSLTFELDQEVPYKIWQELDTIILDIQTSPDIFVFPDADKEIFAKNETRDVMIKRLEAMEAILAKPLVNQLLLESPEGTPRFPKTRRKNMSVVVWIAGLSLISGLVFLLFWLFWRRYKLILDKNIVVCELEKLKSQVAEKNKLLEQEEIVRRAIEETSLKREKEFEQFKLELLKEAGFLEAKENACIVLENALSQKEQEFERLEAELHKKAELLEQEEKTRIALEVVLSQKEKDFEQIKNSLKSSEEVIVNKEATEGLSPSMENEEKPLVLEKFPERRQFFRLDLSKDYNRTIILRIKSQDKSKNVKSFSNNISLGGLCFETRKEFLEKEIVDLRLFFFGDKVPILKIKAEISWEKTVFPVNYYGVCFVSIEEKDKIELNRYMESKVIE